MAASSPQDLKEAPIGLRGVDAVGLAVLALSLRLPAFFASRHLHFDDGVYGSAALAMREGAKPFRDVFSPQGPLHLVLLYLADLAGLRTQNAPRLLPLAAGVVATLALSYAAARVASRGVAILVGALVATTGTLLWTTGPITGDGPAVAFASLALAGALAYRDRPSLARAALTGLAMGAALSTKAIVLPVALLVGWFLLSPRRLRDVGVSIASAVAVGLATTLPFGFALVWEQSVEYHRGSDRLEPAGAQVGKLVTTLLDRDLPILVALALGVAAVALHRGRPASRPGRDGAAAATALSAGFALLAAEPTMFRNHIASLIPALAVLVALRPPPLRWFAVSLVVAAPWWAVHLDDILMPDPYTGSDAAVVKRLRDLPDGAWVITDEPGLAWRAGRQMPPALDDASVKRIDQGMITTDFLAGAASARHVCAVAVWSYRYGARLPGLERALSDAGYEPAQRFSEWKGPGGERGRRTLWLKDGCSP